MWHELVRHGIGGRTVAEAKLRMTHDEWLSWLAYLRKFGSLNDGLRTDLAIARLCLMVNRAMGGKAEMKDFIPVYEDPEPQEAQSMEQIAALFGARKVNRG